MARYQVEAMPAAVATDLNVQRSSGIELCIGKYDSAIFGRSQVQKTAAICLALCADE